MSANYETVLGAGAGAPWRVMVHGMPQDRRVFSAQVETFKDRYCIVLVDLPGHGQSADVPGPFGHIELASHVAGAIENAGVAGCHYWATHTGTSLGLLHACAEPGRFRSMILEGAVGPGDAMACVEVALRRAREVARADGVPAARGQWFDEAAWFDVMRDRPLAGVRPRKAHAFGSEVYHRAILVALLQAPTQTFRLFPGQPPSEKVVPGLAAS